MKKILSCLMVLSISIITLLTPASATSTSLEPLTDNTILSYEYPIQPGTEEWEALETFSQRLEACRIPQDILTNMSTDSLVDAVMNFPFLGNILIYDDTNIGYKNLISQCDAFRELLTRPDGPNALSEKYVSITSKFGTKQNKAKVAYSGYEILYPMFLEVILAQPEIYNSMDYSHQIKTESTTLEYNEGELSYFDITMEKNEEKIVRATTTVQTPKGNDVPCTDYSNYPAFTNEVKQSMNDFVKTNFSIISIVRDPDRRYNCHSYAWYSTSSTNRIWIDDPSLYMSDGSYSERSSPIANYKVFYYNDGSESVPATGEVMGHHSGIVKSGSGNKTIITSKWGPYGLYTHYIYNSPYSGDRTDYSFWTR